MRRWIALFWAFVVLIIAIALLVPVVNGIEHGRLEVVNRGGSTVYEDTVWSFYGWGEPSMRDVADLLLKHDATRFTYVRSTAFKAPVGYAGDRWTPTKKFTPKP